jgi:hypothetical protein
VHCGDIFGYFNLIHLLCFVMEVEMAYGMLNKKNSWIHIDDNKKFISSLREVIQLW